MTLNQYNLMDQATQAHILSDYGVLLADRHDIGHVILLYQIDGFYVEVYYSRQSIKLVRFRSFSNTDELSPYLGRIDIEELINT